MDSPTRLPPGPRTPAALQTLRFVTAPLSLLDECARRFGDVFTLRLVGGPWVLFSSPAHVKALFAASPQVARGGAANLAVFGPLTGSTSSLVTDGPAHGRRRRLLLPALAGEQMRAHTDVIRDIAAAAAARWRPGQPFPLGPQLKEIAVQVVLRTIFGLDRGGQAGELAERLVALGDAGVASPLLFFPALQRDLGRFSPWGRIMRLKRETDDALFAEIARRRGEGDTGRIDVLSLLLQARTEDGAPLSARELRDELVTMLFAGHETTGLALAWAFERILSTPVVWCARASRPSWRRASRAGRSPRRTSRGSCTSTPS